MNADAPPTVRSDVYDLARFRKAQADLYAQAAQELRDGRKRSHWMWFIFPQFEGLGSSSISHHFAIKSLAEAREYLRDPVLGPRIVECTGIVNNHRELSALQVFGSPDDMKFCSSMTLFELASGAKSDFTSALEIYFSGQRDTRTLELVRLASREANSGIE